MFTVLNKPTQSELDEILCLHKLWLQHKKGGKKLNLRELCVDLDWYRKEKCSIDLRELDLSGANLENADLYDAKLCDANLHMARLNSANLGQANLQGANLSGADLESADLAFADLEGANLSGANMKYADLISAKLREADLQGANLSGANMKYGDLIEANLSKANLQGANLTGASMFFAKLTEADLTGTNLTGTRLWGASGNGKELLTIQADFLHIGITDDIVWIDSHSHTWDQWLNFNNAEFEKKIAARCDNENILDWWQQWRPKLGQIIEKRKAKNLLSVIPAQI